MVPKSVSRQGPWTRLGEHKINVPQLARLGQVANRQPFMRTCRLPSRRAKEKRLKKDAGRARWGEYFKTLKGSEAKSNDSDRESEIDLDFAHGKCPFS